MDAFSPNTWRIPAYLAINDSPIASTLGDFAITMTAFVAELDIEWFAIAALHALRKRQIRLYLLTMEYGLELFNDRFIDLICEIGPWTGAEQKRNRQFMKALLKIKKKGLAIFVEDAPKQADSNTIPNLVVRGSKKL
jgi:hypothetical protein